MSKDGNVLGRRGVTQNDRCRVTWDEGHHREDDRADDQENRDSLQ
jgi:hypothetical protein